MIYPEETLSGENTSHTKLTPSCIIQTGFTKPLGLTSKPWGKNSTMKACEDCKPDREEEGPKKS